MYLTGDGWAPYKIQNFLSKKWHFLRPFSDCSRARALSFRSSCDNIGGKSSLSYGKKKSRYRGAKHWHGIKNEGENRERRFHIPPESASQTTTAVSSSISRQQQQQHNRGKFIPSLTDAFFFASVSPTASRS